MKEMLVTGRDEGAEPWKLPRLYWSESFWCQGRRVLRRRRFGLKFFAEVALVAMYFRTVESTAECENKSQGCTQNAHQRRAFVELGTASHVHRWSSMSSPALEGGVDGCRKLSGRSA